MKASTTSRGNVKLILTQTENLMLNKVLDEASCSTRALRLFVDKLRRLPVAVPYELGDLAYENLRSGK